MVASERLLLVWAGVSSWLLRWKMRQADAKNACPPLPTFSRNTMKQKYVRPVLHQTKAEETPHSASELRQFRPRIPHARAGSTSIESQFRNPTPDPPPARESQTHAPSPHPCAPAQLPRPRPHPLPTAAALQSLRPHSPGSTRPPQSA